MRSTLSAVAASMLCLMLSGQAEAKVFKFAVQGDGKHEFTVPECDSATIILTGDGEDSEIAIDAEAVKGAVRVIFKCDLEDAKITITFPEVEKPMTVFFSKECDVSDASCEIIAPLSDKKQPVTIKNDAHDQEDFHVNIIRG